MSLNKKLELKPDFAKPLNWQWVNDLIRDNTKEITKMKPGDHYEQFRSEDLKNLLLNRIATFLIEDLQIYLFLERGLPQKLFKKFRSFFRKREDLKLLLVTMKFGSGEEIDKRIDFYESIVMKGKGQPESTHKARMVVVLAELFYKAGFNRQHCYEKIALLFNLLGNQDLRLKIPGELRSILANFLNSLPSSVSTIKGLRIRYKESFELHNLSDPEKSRIHFTKFIPTSSK